MSDERSEENRGADTPVFVPVRGLNFHADVAKSERDLPHWEQEGVCYYVTFRLADSIPVSVAKQWQQEREEWEQHNPKPWDEEQRVQFRKRFLRRQEQMLDMGEGECYLRRRDVRALVMESVKKFNGVRYDLDTFVIMPNHLHLLVQLRESFRLKKELQGKKGASARNCNKLLKRGGTFWQAESWDRIVRGAEELFAYRTYIENNPAKAGLRDTEYRLEIYNALEI